MIFSIPETLDKANKILPETLVGLRIWERRHIEEWVRANPEMLGEELLVLTTEFDQFVNASDRLDILALDRAGNLVVIELKRDSMAGYADLQAIRYAAMVSSMTVDRLIPYFLAYRRKKCNEDLSETEARNQITRFVDDEAFSELSTRPRLILCSEGFSQEITTTVLWLRDSKIDISCVKITPYKVNGQIVIVPEIVIPLPQARQYLIDIKVKEEEREQSTRGNRPKTMRILVENGLVHPGEAIYLRNGLPSYVAYRESDPMFQATITGKLGQSDAVRWNNDGLEYSVSNLAWKIFKLFHPEQKDPGGVNGSWHWVKEDGRSLWEIAEDFLAKRADA
ncbi:MAG: hypothetical protein JO340_17755 [Acidobacteriaceae bacterium]|nr:hypothetical protein [Acidobacteriaceae bacterium]